MARYAEMVGDIQYVIDDVTLRDSPVDDDSARSRVRELETLGPQGDGERVPLLRLLGQLEEAEEVGWTALERVGGPGGPSSLARVEGLEPEAIAPAIRLAHVLHWRSEYETAEALFLMAFDGVEKLSGVDPTRSERLEAFAHQHIGKMRFDQGRLEEALGHFRKALDLRLGPDTPDDQLASTRQAIAAVEQLLLDTT